MTKSKVTAESFLKKWASASPRSQRPPHRQRKHPRRSQGRVEPSYKHIDGYFNKETTEQVAILRVRLDLNNSQLLKRAIEKLYSREIAAWKFGDR